ncbi:MAG: polysaccharide pyruvyl transferase family protein [Bacteroidia bacterium]|nr:polysaccharide pyruvyl transferase family protein [Bacteroidia bacterium]
MSLINKIRLFWWNEIKIQGKEKENYGDLLGKYIVEKLSENKVTWVRPSNFSIVNFFKPIYVTVGSILSHTNKYCVVWGTGIISREYKIKKAKFLAVRGPQTRKFLLDQGHIVPDVYGDPAILLPSIYFPKITKEYKFGIVPHYNDFKLVKELFKELNNILVIDLMTNNVESTTNQFLKCEKIISSSLHGLIVPHAYNIPAVWQPFSNELFGDNIKFLDYFESVGLQPYEPKSMLPPNSESELLNLMSSKPLLPEQDKLNELRTGLMKVCPFIQ